MNKVISVKEYNKLCKDEQQNYEVHEWTSYKKVKETDFCFCCGHESTSWVKQARESANPKSYIKSDNIFRPQIWGKEVQAFIGNSVITSELFKDKKAK